jgi:hypothetical protein
MVPKDWSHPKDGSGGYIPLLSSSYEEAKEEWDESEKMWNDGFRKCYVSDGWVKKYDDMTYSYEEWAGGEPLEEQYMPSFNDGNNTYLMMYETCSEGTPISPAFKTPEELARWLTDNNASAFGSVTATYEQWLATAKSGFAASGVAVGGKLISGVAYNDHI